MNHLTAILTVWRRDHLNEQIEALLQQTVPPAEIWIYHCGNYVKPRLSRYKKYSNIKYQNNSHDFGYFGRFSMSLHVNTPYVYILDDDVIPTLNWVENSLNLIEKYNAIISSAGRILTPEYLEFENFSAEQRLNNYIGDGDNSRYRNFCIEDTVVDFGCNSWVFKTEWVRHFWSIWPYTFKTGEDIHFSASCQVKAGLSTIVPFQDGQEICGNLTKFYGFDQNASWKRSGFFSDRQDIVKSWVHDQNWRLLNSKNIIKNNK
jgi:hypothetical protein